MVITAIPLLVICCAIYGATLGIWHSGKMAVYVAIKFPLAILLTLIINCLINGISALVTGSGISVRQSLQFLIIGFTIFGIIVAALSPILFFMNLNSFHRGHEDIYAVAQSYRYYLVVNVLVIAFAGYVSHHILFQHIRDFAHTKLSGVITFFNWIAINFFAGAQVTFLLRPFLGRPRQEAQFLREDMFDGNFYENLHLLIKTALES